jgi:hypothetical protein
MSPSLVLWSTKALIVGIVKTICPSSCPGPRSVNSVFGFIPQDNRPPSSFCHREWLLPSLQSDMPSNRTSDSAPLPLKSGIYHRDFQIDEEAQCCRHSLMLCRILHSYEFLRSRFVSRMSDLPSPLLSRSWLTKIALLIS